MCNADDENVWEEAVKGVKRLPKSDVSESKPKRKPVNIKKDTTVILKPLKRTLTLGTCCDVDRNTMRRFKREEFAVEAVLDLHGFTEKKAYGEALRIRLAKENIQLNVICPGFVRSRITDKNTCPMPFFMEADNAAEIIAKRIEKNVGLIVFPWPMRFAAWFGSILPNCISNWLYSKIPYKV